MNKNLKLNTKVVLIYIIKLLLKYYNFQES